MHDLPAGRHGRPRSYGSAGQHPQMKFFYVYILRSQANPERHYIGFTENLEQRLRAHNNGQCPHAVKPMFDLAQSQAHLMT